MKNPGILLLLALALMAPSCAFDSDSGTPVAGNVSAVAGGRSVIGVEVDLLGRRVGAGVWLHSKNGE